MGTEDEILRLKDFLAWVHRRRPIDKTAPVNEETLEFVAQGVERFLEGKNPWPKRQGNRAQPDKMWECYYLATYVEGDQPHLPRHKGDGGAFAIVGERLHLSPQTVESHCRNAAKKMETEDGRAEFLQWFAKYKDATMVQWIPPGHPEAIAERQRREALGLMRPKNAPTRGRPRKGISDKTPPK